MLYPLDHGSVSLNSITLQIVIVTLHFYLPSCLGLETAKIFESNCHQPTCLPRTGEDSHCLFIAEQARKRWILIFIVFDLTRPGIEHGSTASVADTPSTRPLLCSVFDYYSRFWLRSTASKLETLLIVAVLLTFPAFKIFFTLFSRFIYGNKIWCGLGMHVPELIGRSVKNADNSVKNADMTIIANLVQKLRRLTENFHFDKFYLCTEYSVKHNHWQYNFF